MEDTKYIFNNENKVMGARKEKGPVIRIDKDIMKKTEDGHRNDLDTMQDRANDLTGSKGFVHKDVVNLVKRRNFATEKITKDKYYNFIMQVAGFSNEPLTKLWSTKSKKGEEPLLGTEQSLAYERANVDAPLHYTDGDGGRRISESDVVNVLKEKGYLLRSAEVSGQFLLTPTAYSHLLESWEIVRHRCNADVSLDTLVGTEHSTYFARLVALRIQISRFLSGRYYTVSSNYKRLIKQQEALIRGYFRTKFSSNQHQQSYLSEHPYFQDLLQ
jgi:hypothetical protein